jgi:hypothetical protein
MRPKAKATPPPPPESPRRFLLRLALGFACAYTLFFFAFSQPAYFEALSSLLEAELRWVEPGLRSVEFTYSNTGGDTHLLRYRLEIERELWTADAVLRGVRGASGSITGVNMLLNPSCLLALILAWPGASWSRKAAGAALGAGLLLLVFSGHSLIYILSDTFAEGSAQQKSWTETSSFLEAGGASALRLLADAAALLLTVGFRRFQLQLRGFL